MCSWGKRKTENERDSKVKEVELTKDWRTSFRLVCGGLLTLFCELVIFMATVRKTLCDMPSGIKITSIDQSTGVVPGICCNP